MDTIKFKRGTTVPSPSSLSQYEPAINTETNMIYTKNESGEVISLNIGYQDQGSLATRLNDASAMNDKNRFSLSKVNFLNKTLLNGNINEMTNLFVDTLVDTSNIDTSLSETTKYKYTDGYLYPEYSFTILDTSSLYGATIKVGDVTTYITSDGRQSSGYGVENLFDGSLSFAINYYWLTNTGTYNVPNAALLMDFGSVGADIYSLIVHPYSGKLTYTRFLSAYVNVSTDGTSFTQVGSFEGRSKTAKEQYDTVIVNTSGIKKLGFTAYDLTDDPNLWYSMPEMRIIPKTASVVTKQISLGVVPKKLFIQCDKDGTVEFDVSFNNGSTWTNNIGIETIYSVPLSVTQTSLRLRARLIDTGTLSSYSVAWI